MSNWKGGEALRRETHYGLWKMQWLPKYLVLRTWSSRNVTTRQSINRPPYQMVEMWKKTSTVRTKNQTDLRDLLQESTNWDPSYILERKLIHVSGPWENTDRDEVLDQGCESSDPPPQACCPKYNNKKTVIVSVIREITDTSKQGPTRQEKYLDCFCPSCWKFQDFRHNKDEVRD